jgi:hypothetical protein
MTEPAIDALARCANTGLAAKCIEIRQAIATREWTPLAPGHFGFNMLFVTMTPSKVPEFTLIFTKFLVGKTLPLVDHTTVPQNREG